MSFIYLFTYLRFNYDAVSISRHIILNGRIDGELSRSEDMEFSAACLCRQGSEENHENLSHDCRGCSGRDSNRRVSEYQPVTLPTEAVYSVTNREWISIRKMSVVTCRLVLSRSFLRETGRETKFRIADNSCSYGTQIQSLAGIAGFSVRAVQ